MQSKVVLVTLYRRPDYTQRMLDALAQCYGISEYVVYFSQDWSHEYGVACNQVRNLVERWRASGMVYALNSPKLGIDRHKLSLVPTVLQNYEYFVFLEDDIVPAKDFLRFHEWASAKFALDQSILSVSGYSKSVLTEGGLYTARSYSGFNTWGWGMWRDRWEKYMGNQRAYCQYAGDLVDGKFDYWWQYEVAIKRNLSTVYPVVARCQNIGAREGEHTIEEEFMVRDYNPCGAWDYELSADQWEWEFV